MEVRQDQASLGRDSVEPEAPSAKPVVPPQSQVPLVDLDSDWEPQRATAQAHSDAAAQPRADAPSADNTVADISTNAVEPPVSAALDVQLPAESSSLAASTPPTESPLVTAQPTPAKAQPQGSADVPSSREAQSEAGEPDTGSSASPGPLKKNRTAVGGARPAPQPVALPPALPKRDPLDARPSHRPTRSETPGDFQRTGHPVRDRMLAKALEASKQDDSQPRPQGSVSSGASGLSGMDQELEQLAGPRQQLLSRPVRLGNAVLSPAATLLGVTVVGLAAIASLFLILVQFAPRNPSDTPQSAAVVGPNASLSLIASSPIVINLPPPVPPPERTKEPGPWRIGSAEAGQKVVRGTIGSNPFLKAVQEAGLDKSQAYRVYGALKEHKDFDHCRSKDEFVALINRADKRVVAFEYVVSKEEIYQAREESGKLVGKPLDLKVSKHRVQGSILVTGNGFVAAAKDAGLEPAVASVVNRALSGHTNTSQFHPGDRLRVVAQEVTVLGEFHRYAGIEALEYVPIEGTPTRIYYHAAKKQYYDAKGRAPGEGGWRSPVRGAPITSKFNPQRLHPILKKKMPHNGTDFGAPTGTPIYAASYGKITKLGNYGANGNYIAIAHDNGYETGYSHCSRFEPGLKVGDQVKRSQVIGYVGSTGRSTGPHLHFSARKDGAYIDAESLHLDALTVLPSAERAIFNGVRDKYDALLEAVALPPALPPQVVAAVAPVASESEMHGDEADEDGEGAPATPLQPMPASPAVVAVPAQPASPALGGAPAANAAAPPVVQVAPAAGGAFFLTDKELLSSQPGVDDGEVDE